MATDKQVIQWARQCGTHAPENLYWVAEIDGSNKAVRVFVQDEIFNRNFDALPGEWSKNLRRANESVKVGDTWDEANTKWVEV